MKKRLLSLVLCLVMVFSLLPIGSLVFLLFCVTKWGWGFDKYLAEANEGQGAKLSPKLKPYFQFILPLLILIILVQGLIPQK